MKLIRCATLSVADLDRAQENYCQWLDYRMLEHGKLDPTLAASWQAPASAGARFCVLQPASGRDVFLRLVQNAPHPDYRALRTYGWNAIEVCVQDVLKVAERMAASPFEIIGPPREIEGLDAIHPMQVQAPDGEIVYLTEIRDDLPDFDLPRARTLIDCLFILVMGCSDMPTSLAWIEEHIKLDVGRREMAIVYTMIAKAYGLPLEEPHVIATMIHDRDVFLELDQYPDAAIARPTFAGQLAPGISVGSFMHPDFADVAERCQSLWISPPAVFDSCVYDGRLAATVAAPDGTLFEVIDGR
ncbi:MAG: hypothetical protein AAF270_13075 [Pseudomonadota bacterium]